MTTADALDPVELMLAAAAAADAEELAAVRIAAIRSGLLGEIVPGSPDPDVSPAGVVLLGGLMHGPTLPLSLGTRLDSIKRRRVLLTDDRD
jgi:hypothetical protein